MSCDISLIYLSNGVTSSYVLVAAPFIRKGSRREKLSRI